MTRIKASITALIIAITMFVYTHKPSDHEQLSESPTESSVELIAVQSDIIAENLLAKPEAYAPKRTAIVEQAPRPKVYDVVATHYISKCEGCIGITKNGTDVRRTIYSGDKRIIAVDPNVIPLNSTVQVTYEDGTSFQAIAADVGGDIKGARIDVLVATKSEAYRLGRKQAEITIIEGGI